ncbi:aspartate aminotransferase [Fusarium heterosporum]|uniref:Aspartate aminotransferase n=1 Tax=Fusarium heterosporum TaxID=42747 RepID=A0A8H5X0H1_FUSHE|nr:aspartate aminotransferase [Fusarium heterosporum]
MSFSGRKFSINRHTGEPKPFARRFSTTEPSTNEFQSKVHRQFRSAHEGHMPHAGLDASRSSTGVIWCTERAAEYGYLEDPESWANLGQGAPEVEDDIEGCFPRPETINISMAGREYGPTAGIKPLREAVAKLYNHDHRQGKESQYTWENVAIVPGGRAGLIRIAAFAAIPVPLSEEDGYHIHPDKIAEEIARGTSVILTSNPRNPTGRVIQNPELAEIQDICRERATFISDEFYSGYNYTSNCDGTTISAAENVDDVDEDDVLIIDGLTKRFRLPGWRIAWILGPKEYINAIGSCGSYLDGGASHPFQEAAIPMLEPDLVKNEMIHLQSHFRDKRDFVVRRLREMGFIIKYVPDSTFYLWLNLEGLPESISDGLNFFQACLAEKVIVVPGIFFDLNPSRRRDLFDSPCHHFVRLSYGPRLDVLKHGMDAIERVVQKHRKMN